jgi:hypothetical protein
MKLKCEYTIVPYSREMNLAEYEARLETVTKMAEIGWELVAVDDGIAYFKKPWEDNGQEKTAVKEEENEEDTGQSEEQAEPVRPGKLYSQAYVRD